MSGVAVFKREEVKLEPIEGGICVHTPNSTGWVKRNIYFTGNPLSPSLVKRLDDDKYRSHLGEYLVTAFDLYMSSPSDFKLTYLTGVDAFYDFYSRVVEKSSTLVTKEKFFRVKRI